MPDFFGKTNQGPQGAEGQTDRTQVTAGEALAFASSFLWADSPIAKAETDENRRAILRNEAEILLQWSTGWTRTQMLTHLSGIGAEASLSNSALLRFHEAVSQRAQGAPLQYIVGSTGFYGRTFAVRPGCLIPRPETEWLVEAALQWLKSGGVGTSTDGETSSNHVVPADRTVSQGNHCAAPTVVLDVGTGSGAIAVTLALEVPQAQVHAVDLSPQALTIAQTNADSLGADITWHEGDAIALLNSGKLRLNLLVSNPPYIPAAEVDQLDVDVQDHEPRLALDGGPDGLDFYRQIAALDATSVFSPGPAALFLEVGAGQAFDVEALFDTSASGPWAGWIFRRFKDLRGIDRVVTGQRRP